MFQNKYEIGLKNYMSKFLEDRYDKHRDIIERVSHGLTTEQDFTSFMSLAVDIYESAYLRAIEDCRVQFAQHGITLELGNQTR
jgi:hypothetical protein